MNQVLILHVITTLERGGAQRILLDIISRNNSANCQHIVLSLTEEKGFSKDLTKFAKKVYHLNGKGILSFPILLFKTYLIIKKNNPNYIQSWLYHSDFLISILKFFIKKTPIIWTIHHASKSLKHDSLHSKFILFLLSKLSKYVPKYIIYCSKLSYEMHKELGFKCINSKIITNGIDTIKFKPNKELRISSRRKFLIKEKEFIIGIVGRYDPNKGIDCFLKTIKETLKVNQKIRFIMCGTDMDKKNKTLIQTLIDLDLLQNSILLGEQKNMTAIYNSIDLLICPSITESFGLVALEAIACGTDVLCSNISAFRKFINKSDLVKINDHILFAKNIERIFKNRDFHDLDKPKIRNSIVEKYNIKKTVRDYHSIYK